MKTRSELWATLVLIPIVLLAVYPFVWMFFSSFKSNNEIYKPTQLLPQDHSFDLQYVDQLLSWHKDEADLLKAQAAAIRSRTQSLAYDSEAFAALIEQADVIEGQALAVKRDDLFDFRTAFCNSLLIAVLQAFGAVVLCASAGFVFGKYSFKGKTCLLGVALLTILIPRQVIALPLSEWLIQLQLYDSLWAIILPGTVTGIGLLFFAKMFRQVPEELLEVARTEGASELRVFFTVLPLVKSSLLTFAFIQFTMALARTSDAAADARVGQRDFTVSPEQLAQQQLTLPESRGHGRRLFHDCSHHPAIHLPLPADQVLPVRADPALTDNAPMTPDQQ